MAFAPGWGNNSNITYDIGVDQNLINFIEFSFKVMGIDLTYEKFQQMSEDEKKALLRDIKINKII